MHQLLQGFHPSGFNSRTPGGVRRELNAILSNILFSFNSRTPGGVRLSSPAFPEPLFGFQFTHPGRGATWSYHYLHHHIQGFNSRTPGGVRQCGAKLRIIGRINKRNLRLGVLS